MLIEISQKQKDKSSVIQFLSFYDKQRFIVLSSGEPQTVGVGV